jgi:hypothetical protein
VPHGAALSAFVDAALGTDEAALANARAAVHAAIGDAALVDAAAVIASFNAVVKLADGTGIPLEEAKEARTRDIRGALAIDAFRSRS